MFLRLFLLFTLGPMVELYLLIKVGGIIGAFNTILIIILTGIGGAILAQSQGLSVMFEIQKATQEGRMPVEELFDGFFVLVGGFLLITPGFLTDTIGFLFLIPWSPNFLKIYVRRYLEKRVQKNKVIIDIHMP